MEIGSVVARPPAQADRLPLGRRRRTPRPASRPASRGHAVRCGADGSAFPLPCPRSVCVSWVCGKRRPPGARAFAGPWSSRWNGKGGLTHLTDRGAPVIGTDTPRAWRRWPSWSKLRTTVAENGAPTRRSGLCPPRDASSHPTPFCEQGLWTDARLASRPSPQRGAPWPRAHRPDVPGDRTWCCDGRAHSGSLRACRPPPPNFAIVTAGPGSWAHTRTAVGTGSQSTRSSEGAV